LIVPGKQKNSRIFQIDNDLYIFEKGKVGKSPDEQMTFYLNCRDYVTQKCKARAHISKTRSNEIWSSPSLARQVMHEGKDNRAIL